MTTSDQVRAPLPESLMRAIRVTVGEPGMTPTEKLEAVLLIVHGYGLVERETREQGSIDPTGLAIPEPQWSEISALFMQQGRRDSSLAAVNLSLDWMNKGPSAYAAEEATP